MAKKPTKLTNQKKLKIVPKKKQAKKMQTN